MQRQESVDFVIIGGGIYGLYAAHLLLKKKLKVALVECDDRIFSRASFINQARVHQGYHYPRSICTAIASARYFNRFVEDFEPAINRSFQKIYAISNRNSFTSSSQFKKFCNFCQISALEINPSLYFNPGTISGSFETEEFAFDPGILSQILLEKNRDFPNFEILYKSPVVDVERREDFYFLKAGSRMFKTRGVVNCTYASSNQIHKIFGYDLFDIKYEICEIILCDVSSPLRDIGITVMDGPFFSVMPFGKKDIHSLTAVEFTPHRTSLNQLPSFECQKINQSCSQYFLQNCNTCQAKPESAYVYMNQLAKKYLQHQLQTAYRESLFAIKPILRLSEIDDSRPTLVRVLSKSPFFLSILSGKINTIYELEDIINEI